MKATLSPSKRILIIGAGRGLEYLFSTAKKMGCEIYCTDRFSRCGCKELCDHFFQCDATDIDSLERYYRRIRPAGVISSGYHGLSAAARISSKFKKWGSLPGAVKKVMDKKRLRRFMYNKCRVKPDYSIITSLIGLERAIKEISYPVIIKDTKENCGSRNIHVLRHYDDFLNFKSKFFSNIGPELLVERYYDWDTFGMAGIMDKGKLICRHFFREFNRGELYPTEYEISPVGDGIKEPLNRVIADDIAGYLNKSGYRNGPIDVDLLVSPSENEYRIIEIDPLLEGDMVIEHINLCTGMNMDNVLISLAIQEKCQAVRKGSIGYAVIRFFKDMNEKKAILELIDKDDTVKKALHSLHVNVKPAPKEYTARDKWRYGYASFLFYNKGSLSHFRKLIGGGDNG